VGEIMTEKEKSILGILYNANYDEELIKERDVAKQNVYEYNKLNPLEKEIRKKIIKNLFGRIGENFLIEQPFYCDYGYNIEIGENFYSNHNLVILDAAKVVIGNNVFIAPNVGMYTAGHPIDVKQRNEGLEYAKSIKIGNNVWIGGNCVILPGVSIGDNTVVGAGSVVVKNLPENVIAVGNPCRVIKNIM
jgi:maltose O-acetyltransferase